MEEEWEEEEQFVVVELSGIINSDFLTKSDGKCKIVGIDTEQPIIQVGRYVFAGEYEDSLATCVVFEEKPTSDKNLQGVELKYKCHTAKKLMMQRTFLSEKKDGEEGSGGIEVLEFNENPFASRNNTVCSFLHTPNSTMDEGREPDNMNSTGSPNPSSGSEAEDVEQDVNATAGQDNIDDGKKGDTP